MRDRNNENSQEKTGEKTWSGELNLIIHDYENRLFLRKLSILSEKLE